MFRRIVPWRTGRAAVAVLACVAALAAACGTAAPDVPAREPGVVPTNRPLLDPEYRTIPLRVVRGPGGADCLVTDLGVGYNPDIRRIPVAVDTTASGVFVTAQAIGPFAVGTGISYPNGLRDGPRTPLDVVTTVAGLYEPGAERPSLYGEDRVGVLRTEDALAALAPRCGPVRGILGLAIGRSGPGRPGLDSPLLHAQRPLSDGLTLDVPGDAGTLTAGPPRIPARAVVQPLTRSDGLSPTLGPAYRPDVTLCWTVGDARGCGPTVIGSGAPDLLVRPPEPPGDTAVPDGTPVSVTTPDGVVLYSSTTGGASRVAYGTRSGPTVTGLGFLRRVTVGYDLEGGRAVLTPR